MISITMLNGGDELYNALDETDEIDDFVDCTVDRFELLRHVTVAEVGLRCRLMCVGLKFDKLEIEKIERKVNIRGLVPTSNKR